MKVAVFGRTFNQSFLQYVDKFLTCLTDNDVDVIFYKPFYDFIISQTSFNYDRISFFTSKEETPDDLDFMVSIGGDGTFLESLIYLKRFDIPVIGLNSGRLGFLANI